MTTEHTSAEHGPLEPTPSLNALFDNIADIALQKGDYDDPGNGVDAPSYSLRLRRSVPAIYVQSIDFTIRFKDDEDTEREPAVHLVWTEGPITKNVSLFKADDGSVDGQSMSEYNEESERDDLCDTDESLSLDRLYEYMDEIDRNEVTEEERRTVGRILKALREQYGL